jgi:hypothetical protein
MGKIMFLVRQIPACVLNRGDKRPFLYAFNQHLSALRGNEVQELWNGTRIGVWYLKSWRRCLRNDCPVVEVLKMQCLEGDASGGLAG